MSGQDSFGQPDGPEPNQPPGSPEVNPYAQTDANQPRQYQASPPPSGSTFKWIAIAVCCAAFIPCLGICTGLMLPAVQQAREAARRMSCSNNMKQIGLALHNYHSAYGTLPPAYTIDANDRPMHSWRALILPFIEQDALFQQIDFNKPWDDPANVAISQTVVEVYTCPSIVVDPTLTTYVGVVDPSGIMSGPNATKFGDVVDGLSNTLMLVECDSGLAVPWMQPTDIDLNQFFSSGTDRHQGGHQGGAHILMADGAVKFITDSMTPQLRQSMVSKGGGETFDIQNGSIGEQTIAPESKGAVGQLYRHTPSGAEFSRPSEQYMLATGSAAKNMNADCSAALVHNGGAHHGERIGVLIIEPLSDLGPEPPQLNDLAMSLVNQMGIENKTLEEMGPAEVNGIPVIRYVVTGDVEGTGRLRYSCLLFSKNDHLFQIIAFAEAKDAAADDPQFKAIHESLRF